MITYYEGIVEELLEHMLIEVVHRREEVFVEAHLAVQHELLEVPPQEAVVYVLGLQLLVRLLTG